MKCDTRDFGEVSYSEQDVIKFSQALYGFEEYKNYIVLLDDQVQNSICWLQSIDDKDLCFIVVDTFSAYDEKIIDDVSKSLGQGKRTVFGICVIANEVQNSTVNLKSPIIINEDNRTAMQTMLTDNYKLKQPLFESEV